MNPSTKPPIDNNPQTNPTGRPPLSEKDFIQNGWTIASLPFWLWIFLIAAITAIAWGSKDWYEGFIQKQESHDPFLQVTNREFSVFLWQFPSFMRMHTSKKTGYLPGFSTSNENFTPENAEEFVSAPPDLIFLYHTWHRLLAPENITRPISPKEFKDFLEQLPEWKPENWPKAPQEYAQLIKTKSYTNTENLQTLPESTLPIIVRQAFSGWKSYFIEGPQINELNPTFGEVKTFLETHAHYARNYWRNIEEVNDQKVAGLDYLKGFVSGTFIPDANVPKEQLTPFLKVAMYNAKQNESEK